MRRLLPVFAAVGGVLAAVAGVWLTFGLGPALIVFGAVCATFGLLADAGE